MSDRKNSPTFKRKFADEEYYFEKRAKITHSYKKPRYNVCKRWLGFVSMLIGMLIGMLLSLVSAIMLIGSILVASMVIASIASLVVTVLLIYIDYMLTMLNVTILSSKQFAPWLDIVSKYVLAQMSWLYSMMNYTFSHVDTYTGDMCMIGANFSSGLY